jgi:hypothetical protein
MNFLQRYTFYIWLEESRTVDLDRLIQQGVKIRTASAEKPEDLRLGSLGQLRRAYCWIFAHLAD